MNVLIAGWSATGKTHYAKRLAADLGYRYVSGSGQLVEALGTGGVDWLESGERLWEQRSDGTLDRRVDAFLNELLEHDALTVMDSWTMPWLHGGTAVRVWIDCEPEVRVRKALWGRSDSRLSAEEVSARLQRKDRSSAAHFADLYGFRFGSAAPVFDVTLDASPYFQPESGSLVRQENDFRSLLLVSVTEAAARTLQRGSAHPAPDGNA